MITQRDILSIASILALLALACGPLLIFGPQEGHSLHYNLSWSYGFCEELSNGTLYPRWLPNLNDGRGSPVFFFYGPVPFYAIALGCSVLPDQAFLLRYGVGATLILMSSGLSFYVLARHIADPLCALLGSLIYALAPYHFVFDLLIRQAIGEVAAYIWIPLIVVFTNRIILGKGGHAWLALTYALLIMTHLPSALLFSIFAPLMLLRSWSGINAPRAMLGLALSGSLGISLAGVYLIPALAMQGSITAEKWATEHLIYSRWFLMDGVAAPAPSTEYNLALIMALYTASFFMMFFVLIKSGLENRKSIGAQCFGVLAGVWFLMVPMSMWFWELVPMLQRIQFPWRSIVLLDFALAVLFVLALNGGEERTWSCLRFVMYSIFLLIMAASSFKALEIYAEHGRLYKDAEHQNRMIEWISVGHDAAEYIPAEVRQCPIERGGQSRLKQVIFDEEHGDIRVVEWAGRRIVLTADLDKATEVAVRQFLYPGWAARFKEGGEALYLEPCGPHGVMRLALPAGRHDVVLELRPQWPEVLGYVVSSVALFLWITLVVVGRVSRGRVDG